MNRRLGKSIPSLDRNDGQQARTITGLPLHARRWVWKVAGGTREARKDCEAFSLTTRSDNVVFSTLFRHSLGRDCACEAHEQVVSLRIVGASS